MQEKTMKYHCHFERSEKSSVARPYIMKTTVVICEYNPFTLGHERHLSLAREQTGADTVACIMSGSFTQRGDPAVMDRYLRAEIACRLGADIVVELPLIYAISPADNFAFGAIKTLSALPNVAYLSFGSECGDAELLKKAAKFLNNEPKEFKDILARLQSEGNSYPKARSLALMEYSKTDAEYLNIADILEYPNNVLAITYIQNLERFNLTNVEIHTIKREGDFNDTKLDAKYPSASAIREALSKGKLESVKNAVPSLTYEFLKRARADADSGTVLGDMCLFRMKDINGHDLANYYDYRDGLNNRLKLAAADSVKYEEFLEKAKTKKYTMARIKRLSLYALFDITQAMYAEASNAPKHVYVLALKSSRKKDLLPALHSSCENVLVRYSDIDKVDKSLRFILKLDFKAQGLLTLINRTSTFNHSMILT